MRNGISGGGRVMASTPKQEERESPLEDDLDHIVDGIPAIAKLTGSTPGKTRRRLERGEIPGAGKMGGRHVVYVRAYRAGMQAMAKYR